MDYWIVEHPNRGVFVGFDWNSNMDWKPKFQWSIPYSDGHLFFSEKEAKDELAKISQHVAKCSISKRNI